jgi:hypothetical protein
MDVSGSGTEDDSSDSGWGEGVRGGGRRLSSKLPFASKWRLPPKPSSVVALPLDSGNGGMGGGTALLVGLCGELSFLDDGEPGNILLKLYDENRLEALRSNGS